MADLISREAALAILYECGGDEITPPNMIEMRGRMYKLPAVDAVEVVRCKDCKYWREESLWCDMNSKDRGEHYNWYAEDFCSYGERREENAASL